MNYRLISKSSKHFLSKSANISCWWVPRFPHSSELLILDVNQGFKPCPFAHFTCFLFPIVLLPQAEAGPVIWSLQDQMSLESLSPVVLPWEKSRLQYRTTFMRITMGKYARNVCAFIIKIAFFFTSSNLPIYSYVVLCLPCISLAARTLETLLFVLLVFESVSHSQPWTCILPSAVPKQQPDGFVLLRYELPFNLTGTTFVILWLPISQRTLHSSLKCHGSLEFCSFS